MFDEIESWTQSLQNSFQSTRPVKWCRSMWEGKIWHWSSEKISLKWLSCGSPLPQQQHTQMPSLKTRHFWWWQISPNSCSESFPEFWGYIPLLVGAHTFPPAPSHHHYHCLSLTSFSQCFTRSYNFPVEKICSHFIYPYFSIFAIVLCFWNVMTQENYI